MYRCTEYIGEVAVPTFKLSKYSVHHITKHLNQMGSEKLFNADSLTAPQLDPSKKP
jgi:hypothetical protein